VDGPGEEDAGAGGRGGGLCGRSHFSWECGGCVWGGE
jgi:hypothetical protein